MQRIKTSIMPTEARIFDEANSISTAQIAGSDRRNPSHQCFEATRIDKVKFVNVDDNFSLFRPQNLGVNLFEVSP
jgi:hypothetical protein